MLFVGNVLLGANVKRLNLVQIIVRSFPMATVSHCVLTIQSLSRLLDCINLFAFVTVFATTPFYAITSGGG